MVYCVWLVLRECNKCLLLCGVEAVVRHSNKQEYVSWLPNRVYAHSKLWTWCPPQDVGSDFGITRLLVQPRTFWHTLISFRYRQTSPYNHKISAPSNAMRIVGCRCSPELTAVGTWVRANPRVSTVVQAINRMWMQLVIISAIIAFALARANRLRCICPANKEQR